VFGKRAGEYAARYAADAPPARIPPDAVEAAAKDALEPFGRATNGSSAEGPYQIQQGLQEMMQELVGIVRHEEEMRRALTGLESLKLRAAAVSVNGNREYNPGWHTALDLENLLTVSEAVTRSALERKESRGAQFREDYLEKDPAYAGFNITVTRGGDGEMVVGRLPIPPMRDDLRQIVEENK
jgi:succinate dehydrogenase / fumarate reductase flavoprotein subunit